MNRRSLTVATVATLLAGTIIVLSISSRDSIATQRALAAESIYRLTGDFDVQLSTQFARTGAVTPPGEDGTTLVTDVSRIDLLSEWAVLSKREAARDITFVVPREQVIFINATE